MLKTHFLFISLMILMACKSSENEPQQVIPDTPITVAPEDNTPPKGVADYGQLKIVGNKLTDKNGNAIQLRGMSFFWSQWIGKYYNEQTVAWLKTDWQCNIVRAAMAVENDGYLTNKNAERDKVYKVVDAAIKNGIYVIVDWHDHNAEKHQTEAIEFFGELAKKYNGVPNIIYETYNEPLNVSWTAVLKPYHNAVIAEIRKYDKNNLIVCGTRNWSQNVNDVIGNKIDDPNVAYSLHYYAATHKQSLRDIAKAALDANVPLFVTEYGVSEASGDGSINAEEAAKWWAFLDENKISHLNWSIADKEELSAVLRPNASQFGNWAKNELTVSGSMIRDEIRNKN